MSRPPLGRGAVARSWPIFATEAPEHVVELRGALLQTESDALNSGEAGAGARRETVVKRAPAASFRGGGESTTAPAQRVALVATKTRSAEASAAAFVAVRCRESPHRTSNRGTGPARHCGRPTAASSPSMTRYLVLQVRSCSYASNDRVIGFAPTLVRAECRSRHPFHECAAQRSRRSASEGARACSARCSCACACACASSPSGRGRARCACACA